MILKLIVLKRQTLISLLLLIYFTSFSFCLATPVQPQDSAEQLTYCDQANGYSLTYPSDMTVDDSLSAIRTVISNSQLQIEIYYDNFSGTASTTDSYISYSNAFMKDTKDHELLDEKNFTVHNLSVHLLKWKRNKLARVDEDKNYYASAEIVKNNNEVYTLFFKSTQPITNEQAIIKSFRLIPKEGTGQLGRLVHPSINALNAETQAVYDQFFSDSAPQRWGIFEKTSPKSFDYLNNLEKKLGYKFDVVTRYQSLTGRYFPGEDLKNAYANSRLVQLTMQTFLWGASAEQNQSIMYDILNGQYDAYLNDYAKQLKAFGHPVLFRLNNEMNGDWCWYSAYYTSKDTDIYKDVWRYIYRIFQDNGVDNVLWVWNPHSPSDPTFQWNHYLMYYPGDEYVDIIGLTGYNNGTYYPGEKWRSFDEIYRKTYDEYCHNFQKPFMITEFGSSSIGGDKPAWIHDMFTVLPEYNRIKLFVWWNATDYDVNGHPARIYLLDENDATIAAFQQGFPPHS
jgi:mannan endo-1,4-beta-mannosidase